ncbi:MAG: cupin domain-containing protein [Chloroflexi bacterium]|nr:cupin domain-containing protein [Chloroflexota bacterium]
MQEHHEHGHGHQHAHQHEHQHQPGREHQHETKRLNVYEQWAAGEGIPIIREWSIRDVRTLELHPWKRKGGQGVLINLHGLELSADTYVCEIPPGQQLHPQRHLYEEMIFVLSGRGATTVWNEGGSKHTFEWQEGSLFAPPLNAWHQHFNGSGEKPARFMGVTLAPVFMNLCNDLDFIFNNPFVFKKRFSGEADYFSPRGTFSSERVWESNFIPDARSFRLLEWKERGAGGSNVMFELSNNIMASHVSEFPVGTYKKAHYGHGEAQVIILSGTGYTLIWPQKGGEKIRIDWQAGTLFAPIDLWFHQHFNTGKEPARYLALRAGGSRKFRGIGPSARYPEGSSVSVKKGGRQIEYEDEDPEIRRMFKTEVEKTGAPYLMSRFFPGG